MWVCVHLCVVCVFIYVLCVCSSMCCVCVHLCVVCVRAFMRVCICVVGAENTGEVLDMLHLDSILEEVGAIFIVCGVHVCLA